MDLLQWVNLILIPVLYYIRQQEKTISEQDKRLAVAENNYHHLELNMTETKELFKNHIIQYNENSKELFSKIDGIKEDIHKVQLAR
jgi:hypothetical protein